MSQPFSFGFDNEDIEDDGPEEVTGRHENENTESGNTTLIEPRLHTLDEFVRQLLVLLLRLSIGCSVEFIY